MSHMCIIPSGSFYFNLLSPSFALHQVPITRSCLFVLVFLCDPLCLTGHLSALVWIYHRQPLCSGHIPGADGFLSPAVSGVEAVSHLKKHRRFCNKRLNGVLLFRLFSGQSFHIALIVSHRFKFPERQLLGQKL